MAQVLIAKRNEYENPGSPNCGRWGQTLIFASGEEMFDAGHRHAAAIERATLAATGGRHVFAPGKVAFDGQNWTPV